MLTLAVCQSGQRYINLADDIEVNKVAMSRKGKRNSTYSLKLQFCKIFAICQKKGRDEIDFELFYKLMLSILVRLDKASHAQST